MSNKKSFGAPAISKNFCIFIVLFISIVVSFSLMNNLDKPKEVSPGVVHSMAYLHNGFTDNLKFYYSSGQWDKLRKLEKDTFESNSGDMLKSRYIRESSELYRALSSDIQVSRNAKMVKCNSTCDTIRKDTAFYNAHNLDRYNAFLLKADISDIYKDDVKQLHFGIERRSNPNLKFKDYDPKDIRVEMFIENKNGKTEHYYFEDFDSARTGFLGDSVNQHGKDLENIYAIIYLNGEEGAIFNLSYSDIRTKRLENSKKYDNIFTAKRKSKINSNRGLGICSSFYLKGNAHINTGTQHGLNPSIPNKLLENNVVYNYSSRNTASMFERHPSQNNCSGTDYEQEDYNSRDESQWINIDEDH